MPVVELIIGNTQMGILDILNIGGKVVDAVKEVKTAKIAKAAKAEELEAALHERQLDQIAKSQDYEQALIIAQTSNTATSWKDELWNIIFAGILLWCFVPGADQYALHGFDVLAKTPIWFQVALTGIISASCGTKAYAWWNKPGLH